jgi:hypothetical protein
VVAVVTIVLLATPPKPEPVKVWFVRATNYPDHKRLVFQGTNGTLERIELDAYAITGAVRHVSTMAGLGPTYHYTSAGVAAGTNFYFALEAPPKDVPYFVMWQFREMGGVSMPWEGFRWRCFKFFYAHGMHRLARRFEPTPEEHYIPSTEIKE